MTPYACYYLPPEVSREISYQILPFANLGRRVELQVPVLTPAQLSAVTRIIKEQRNRYLKDVRANEVIAVLDEAVQLWLEPRYELRQLAEEVLPVITGYDQEMIRLFLNRYLRNFRKEKLMRIVDEDFPNPLVLDEFRPRKAGGLTRAYGPELVTHIFSGNVPALPLWSIAAGLLVKSATLGKVSSAEPLFPVLFAKTLEQVDAELAGTIALVWWKGGHEALERTAFAESRAVVAYGSQETISQVAQRVPAGVRFLAHGHKVSFGVITRECLDGSLAWSTANRAAHDASWFDQQGCLSPHVVYVERGGKYSPRDFARMLAREMDNFQKKMPRSSLTTEETSAIMKSRAKAEFASFSDPEVELLASENGTSWTVVYREQTEFPFSVLNRVVTVVPIDNIYQLPNNLAAIRGVMQTAGIACPPQRFAGLIAILGECGINRITFLGSMPQPEPGWHHDGRFNLADLVYWCDVESAVEAQMDLYDPYRE